MPVGNACVSQSTVARQGLCPKDFHDVLSDMISLQSLFLCVWFSVKDHDCFSPNQGAWKKLPEVLLKLFQMCFQIK